MKRVRTGSLAALTALAVLVVTGCAPEEEPEPQPAPTADATEEPAEAEFVADGTAEDNLAVFTRVTESVWASDRRAEGRAYVDALVDVGFDKDAMQVTEDLSTVGNAAESILFSVLWGDECLIGQVGPETGDPVTAVDRALTGDLCLIGNTRAIDW